MPKKTTNVTEEVKAVSHLTAADKIWNEIKSLPIQMFGLPNQFIDMHCTPVTVEPSKLYLTIRSSATLPSLEAAIADKFVVEQADRFIIVTPKLSFLAGIK